MAIIRNPDGTVTIGIIPEKKEPAPAPAPLPEEKKKDPPKKAKKK